MKNEVKSKLGFLIISSLLGLFIGSFIWIFLRLVHFLTDYIWATLPAQLPVNIYTIVVCFIGGLLIGLIQKYFGPCIVSLEEVRESYKGNIPESPTNLIIQFCVTLLPLIFGGTIGPEAGLTGLVVAICYWCANKIAFLRENSVEYGEIGFSATLGILFRSPLFGYIEPIENKDDEFKLPKRVKTTAIFLAIVTGFGIFLYFNKVFGTAGDFPRFDAIEFSFKELFSFIPLIILSFALAFLYKLFNYLGGIIKEKLNNRYLLMAIIAAFNLGIIGYFLPLTLFSGEDQIGELALTYTEYAPITILMIAILKVYLINICLNLGWWGGNFFPSIFAGVCLGFAMALFFGINTAFAVAITTASFLTFMMQKPLAVSLLLLLLFPVTDIIYILAAAYITSLIPLPNVKKLIDSIKKETR